MDSHPAPRLTLCLARDVDCRSRIVRLRLARPDTTFLLSRKEPDRNLSTAHFSTNLSKLPNYSSAYSQRRRAGKSTVKYHLIGFTAAIPISKDFSPALLCMPPSLAAFRLEMFSNKMLHSISVYPFVCQRLGMHVRRKFINVKR